MVSLTAVSVRVSEGTAICAAVAKPAVQTERTRAIWKIFFMKVWMGRRG